MAQHDLRGIEGDMIEDRRRDMEDLVRQVILKPENVLPQNMARAIKELCDSRYGGNWSCHVGPSFGR